MGKGLYGIFAKTEKWRHKAMTLRCAISTKMFLFNHVPIVFTLTVSRSWTYIIKPYLAMYLIRVFIFTSTGFNKNILRNFIRSHFLYFLYLFPQQRRSSRRDCLHLHICKIIHVFTYPMSMYFIYIKWLYRKWICIWFIRKSFTVFINIRTRHILNRYNAQIYFLNPPF